MQDSIAVARLIGVFVQIFFMAAVAIFAAVLVGYTLACAFGLAGWLSLSVQFGEAAPVNAGIALQLALLVLTLGILAYFPANRRILKLENSHRQFAINMEDVARAYAAVHQADRSGAFKLKSEFDAVKERMLFLRNHPDLGGLEPGVLEIASQMGVLSEELAKTYSDEKIERARTFLVQRQQELETFSSRIDEAKVVANDIRNWAARIELDEDVAVSEINRLRDMLDEVLPELNDPAPSAMAPFVPISGGNTVHMRSLAAAE